MSLWVFKLPIKSNDNKFIVSTITTIYVKSEQFHCTILYALFISGPTTTISRLYIVLVCSRPSTKLSQPIQSPFLVILTVIAVTRDVAQISTVPFFQCITCCILHHTIAYINLIWQIYSALPSLVILYIFNMSDTN